MPLLILDLDETLIYGTEQELSRPADFSFSRFFIYKRPHLDLFLRTCAGLFDLAVWSTASEHYVVSAVSGIFPERFHLKFIWDYARCVYTPDPDTREFVFLKKLDRVVALGYKLEEILIVEDTPEKIRNDAENALLVAPFTGDPADDELLRLESFLRTLSHCTDFRRLEKETWGFRRPNST